MNRIIPPNSRADIQKDLDDPTFSIYVYVGKESDEAWDNAKTVATIIARHRNYLVIDRTGVPECGDDALNVGAVFGFKGKFLRFLTQDDANNLNTVLKAVTTARKP